MFIAKHFHYAMQSGGIYMYKTKVITTKNQMKLPEQKHLGFGKYFTDHILTMDFNAENGWYNLQIIPYDTIAMRPETTMLHYGQAVFEGMKAFRAADDKAFSAT